MHHRVVHGTYAFCDIQDWKWFETMPWTEPSIWPLLFSWPDAEAGQVNPMNFRMTWRCSQSQSLHPRNNLQVHRSVHFSGNSNSEQVESFTSSAYLQLPYANHQFPPQFLSIVEKITLFLIVRCVISTFSSSKKGWMMKKSRCFSLAWILNNIYDHIIK